jgi:predicted RNA-binding Zn ribbon-like protein
MHDTDSPAPGELWRIQRLVNTADIEQGTDALDPAWPASVGLAGPEDSLTDAGMARVRRFREALRRVLLAHNGETVDPAAVSELDAIARGSAVIVGFGADGTPRLEAAGAGVDAVLARLLAIVAQASAEGTWERLKACPADACQWAFYDFSRNHSRTWCDMKVCGNRAKARSYRTRR